LAGQVRRLGEEIAAILTLADARRDAANNDPQYQDGDEAGGAIHGRAPDVIV